MPESVVVVVVVLVLGVAVVLGVVVAVVVVVGSEHLFIYHAELLPGSGGKMYNLANEWGGGGG